MEDHIICIHKFISSFPVWMPFDLQFLYACTAELEVVRQFIRCVLKPTLGPIFLPPACLSVERSSASFGSITYRLDIFPTCLCSSVIPYCAFCLL